MDLAYTFAECVMSHLVMLIKREELRLVDCRVVDSNWKKKLDGYRFVIYDLEFIDWDIPKKWVVMYRQPDRLCEKRKKALADRGVLIGKYLEVYNCSAMDVYNEEEIFIDGSSNDRASAISKYHCKGKFEAKFSSFRRAEVTANLVELFICNIENTTITARSIILDHCSIISSEFECYEMFIDNVEFAGEYYIDCVVASLQNVDMYCDIYIEAKKIRVFQESIEYISGSCEILEIYEPCNIVGPLADSARIIKVMGKYNISASMQNSGKIVYRVDNSL